MRKLIARYKGNRNFHRTSFTSHKYIKRQFLVTHVSPQGSVDDFFLLRWLEYQNKMYHNKKERTISGPSFLIQWKKSYYRHRNGAERHIMIFPRLAVSPSNLHWVRLSIQSRRRRSCFTIDPDLIMCLHIEGKLGKMLLLLGKRSSPYRNGVNA